MANQSFYFQDSSKLQTNRHFNSSLCSSLLKRCFPALVLTAAVTGAKAETLSSPKGAEVYGTQAIIGVPSSKTVRIGWSYPVNFETPDLVFKVYHSTNLSMPVREWALLTNIPGYIRSATIRAAQDQEFFVMTASNYLGESKYASE